MAVFSVRVVGKWALLRNAETRAEISQHLISFEIIVLLFLWLLSWGGLDGSPVGLLVTGSPGTSYPPSPPGGDLLDMRFGGSCARSVAGR